MEKKKKSERNTRVERAVREAQAEQDGVVELQERIDSGLVWHLEGHSGREGMRALEAGACFLPLERNRDFWGNTVPARTDLKPGTKGTLENAARFYGVEGVA